MDALKQPGVASLSCKHFKFDASSSRCCFKSEEAVKTTIIKGWINWKLTKIITFPANDALFFFVSGGCTSKLNTY